jgi:hypothetical protein
METVLQTGGSGPKTVESRGGQPGMPAESGDRSGTADRYVINRAGNGVSERLISFGRYGPHSALPPCRWPATRLPRKLWCIFIPRAIAIMICMHVPQPRQSLQIFRHRHDFPVATWICATSVEPYEGKYEEPDTSKEYSPGQF